jgi:hypothetical protein
MCNLQKNVFGQNRYLSITCTAGKRNDRTKNRQYHKKCGHFALERRFDAAMVFSLIAKFINRKI